MPEEVREGHAKAEPKVTHEVKVTRANGDEEVVAQRVLSPNEASLIVEAMRREAPEMVAEAEQSAIAQKEATKHG